MLGILTRELISRGCPTEHRADISNLLENSCSHNLPGVSSSQGWGELVDRIQLAAIRGSEWNIENIKRSVALANRDWRDLLVSAGFANDPSAHIHWQKSALEDHSVS